MTTTRYVAPCLVAGVLAFGAGSAASWLLSRTASVTGGDGAFAEAVLAQLVPAVLDDSVDASETARTIHVAKYEVTIAEWDRCAADGGCTFTPRRRPWQNDNHPVTGVSWMDVQQYVRWVSNVTDRNFRLPREKEWDFLARDVVAQEVGKLWDDPRLAWAADYANFARREQKPTQPVGHFSVSRQGIHDLDGNVWEWTDSCWRRNRAGAADGASVDCGGVRILAGKHKTYQSEFIRQVPPGGCSIGYPPANLGFRLVLDDEPAAARQSFLKTLLRHLHERFV